MQTKSPRIPVHPEVFRWLRLSSGWSYTDISNLLNVSVDWVSKWESGEKYPTLNEIKTLSKAFKRPLAAFFLPQPETELYIPKDFRRLPGEDKTLSKKTLLAIRKARNLQEISGELLANLDQECEPDIVGAKLTNNPEIIASDERDRLGISIELQNSWKTPYEAFNQLRAIIELKNVYVFQFPMEIEEIRGFTLTDSKPYIIVLNSSDKIEPRIFTLLHEYGHVLLNEPALCTPDNPIVSDDFGASVEKWCNTFAASLLLPKKRVIEEFEKYGLTQYGRIAKRNHVSYSALLTRLVSLNLISYTDYQIEIGKLQMKEIQQDDKSGGSGETSAKKALREKGGVFVSLVLENSQRGFITYSEALGHLEVKTKHLKELTKITPGE